MKRKVVIIFGAVLFAILGAVLAGETAKVRVKVKGYDNLNGSIRIAVFDKKASFPQGKRLTEGTIELKALGSNDIAEYIFDLPTGKYAFAVMHDENNNGIMDMNFIGLPMEKYGFSRNPGFSFGAPYFEDVVINLPTNGIEIVIQLK